MNGVKRGLFSNEAGSGSAPCAAAAAEASHPAKVGLMQAFGVFIDTLLCTCTALIMLVVPESVIAGQEGMGLLQAAMAWHMGEAGVIFIAAVRWLFSFTTLPLRHTALTRASNVACLFGDNRASPDCLQGRSARYAVAGIGGLAAYTCVWDLGKTSSASDCLTMLQDMNRSLIPLSKQALELAQRFTSLKKRLRK